MTSVYFNILSVIISSNLNVSTVPNATVRIAVNNVLLKTLLNSSLTTLCGPLCPTVSLEAWWRQHSGAIGSPLMLVHVECTNCPLSIGHENVLAIELISRCVQVRNSSANKHQ